MSENVSNIQTYDLFWKRKFKSIKDISYSIDGNHILIGLGDGRVYLFNNNGNEIWQNKVNNISCTDISGNSSKIVIGTNTGSLYLFSKSGMPEWEHKIMGSINSLSISNDGRLICVGTNMGVIFCFDDRMNELWRHKVKGAIDGGISYSADGKFIAVGSWNTVQLFNIDGRDIWKYKSNKKITDVAVSNNGTYIAACTKGSFAIIGDGTLINEQFIPNGFNSVSICDNYIYAISSNTIYTFDEKGQQLGKFASSQSLKKIRVSASNEFITTNSEDILFVLSSLMKPDVTFLTDELTYGEEQILKIEILNKSPKELNLDLELISDSLNIKTSKPTIKVLQKEKLIIEYNVIPLKIGDINVDFKLKNKSINIRKIIKISPQKVELNINLHPKYDFNAEDDDITIMIDIENVGKVKAKNIRVEGYESLFLPELEVGSKETLVYKIKLPSGDHNLSNRLIYEDEINNESLFDCSCEIHVEKAPFVWGIKQPISRFIPGKTTTVNFNVKNIKNEDLNLILNITSKQVKISPTNISVNVNSLETKDIAFDFTPIESGENINLDVAIEYGGKIQKYHDYINVDPKPPDIQIIGQIQKKDKYRVGEEVYESIELCNKGECNAVNIEIPGVHRIPILETGERKIINICKQSDEANYYRQVIKSIKYQDEFDGQYCVEYESKPYTVLSPEIKIRVPEIQLQENVKTNIKFELENICTELLKDILVELIIHNETVFLEKKEHFIEKISPNTAKTASFEVIASQEGKIDFDINVKQHGNIIEQISEYFVVTSKIPKLEFHVDDSNMLQNNFSILKLEIINNGDSAAKDVSIKLQTEIDRPKMSKLEKTFSDNPNLKEIEPNERKEIIFQFAPKIAGKASLKIISSYISTHRKTFAEYKEEVYVNIRQELSKPESIINIAEFSQGSTIFKGDAVVTNSELTSANNNTKELFNEMILNNKQLDNDKNQGSIKFEGDAVIQNNTLTTGNSTELYRLIKYRDLCTQANEDGVITKNERDILKIQARDLCLTESEIKQIEDEVFGKQNKDLADIEMYRKQASQLFSKGNIGKDARDKLDLFRVVYNLNREQQKQIDDELLDKYCPSRFNDKDIKIRCSNCNNINNSNTKFCTECGVQLP